MVLPLIPALRRVMRQHQGVPPRLARLPLWRLLGGELLWAVRQIAAAPWVLGGLVLGAAGTLLVLGTGAPGPVLDLQWRILLAAGVGLLLAAGGRMIPSRRSPSADGDAEPQVRPVTAATVVAATVAAATLVGWLIVWLVTSAT